MDWIRDHLWETWLALSIALGVADVSPLDNATGYATYANGGQQVESHLVREVKDRDGTVIWEANPDTNRAVDQDVAAADLLVARSGAATVSEATVAGVPALYVPLAIGNGEQRLNASGSVSAGASLMVDNAEFSPSTVVDTILPLLADESRDVLPVEARGGPICQVVPSGPGFDNENNLRMINMLLYHAARRIDVVSPYFVPDGALLEAITSASYRGVDVELYTPEKADQFVVDHAQRSYYQALLEAGVRIFRYPAPQVLHTKLVVMDDVVGVIGSSNMDFRSFQLNFELSVLVFGGDAVPALAELVDGYKEQSTELDLEQWKHRPWPGRYVDNVARLTSALQ